MKTKEKLCLFFASDYHFEMISLPYINQKLKENKNVMIMTENNLSDTMSTLLDRVNLKDEEKKKIEKIDWQNNDLYKIKKMEEQNGETVVFVKGNKDYINSINKDINNLTFNTNIQIIDCYDLNEVNNNNVKEISKDYSKVLSTSGVEKLL